LKKSKSEWFSDENEFCGFHINQDGVHTLDCTAREVTECPRTQNAKAVCDFLGLRFYYRKFFWHYVHIALPLYCLYKIGKNNIIGDRHSEPLLEDIGTVKFVWNGQAGEAFDIFKIPLARLLC
jgi:hypothetical protein